MFKAEFERLAGYEVSYEDYKTIIEPMYMATNLNKEEFVQTINKKRFALKSKAQLLKEIKAVAENIADIAGHNTFHEEEQQLRALIKEYCERFYNCEFFNLFGVYEYPEIKRGCDYPTEFKIYDDGYNLIKTVKIVALTKEIETHLYL